MVSAAHTTWFGPRRQRIQELDAFRQQAASGSIAEQQADWSLLIRVAAEFQGFCVELQQLVADELIQNTATQNNILEVILRSALRPTQLNVGNPTEDSIRRDFARVGIQDIWTLPGTGSVGASIKLATLKRLLRLRNAIAHGQYIDIARHLSGVGTVHDFVTSQCLPDLDHIVAEFDEALSIAIDGIFNSADHGEDAMSGETDPFEIGTPVRVPWGLDEVDGTVEAIYGQGPAMKLVVSLHVPESETGEAETLVFPARLVEPIAGEAERDPTGYWLEEYHYWERVAAALAESLAGSGAGIQSQLHLAGGRSDVVATMPNGTTLLVECKATMHPTARLIRDAVTQLTRFATDLPGPTVGLVALRNQMPAVVETEALEAAAAADIPVSIISWRDDRDNDAIRAAIFRLTGQGSGTE